MSNSVFVESRTVSGEDVHGNATFTVQRREVTKAFIALGSNSVESSETRKKFENKITLHLPHGSTVALDDVFEIDGQRWQLDGSPEAWPVMNGFRVPVMVPIRRVDG
jgi:hypothetical protein